jgi:putative hemolysin
MDPDGSLSLQIFFLLVLIGINAFFAASEIAIISVNAQKIRKQAEEGDKKAQLLQNLVSEPSRFLATIQVGVTLAGLLASAVAAESFSDNLSRWFRSFGLALDETVITLIAVIVITLVLSYFQLVLGELVPKRLAMQKPEQISRFAVAPICLLAKVAAPFVKFLSISTNLVIKLFGGNPALNEEKISEEEIRLMVEVGQEKGVIQTTEKEMINNIFEFDNTAVSEVMTHRTDVIALPLDATLDEVTNIVVNEKFSRIPVYDETIDNIVGILHVQDLIPVLRGNAKTSFSLKKIIRNAYMVPSSKKTDELFKELQKNKTHLAVIIDEYGGTAGIVTIEDLIEEIVGNIFDEHDEEIKEVERIDNRTFMVEGLVGLGIVNELLEVELPEGDYDTLGGFVIAQLDRIPGEDEKPVVEYHNIVFQVEAVEERRIAKVKIIKP